MKSFIRVLFGLTLVFSTAFVVAQEIANPDAESTTPTYSHGIHRRAHGMTMSGMYVREYLVEKGLLPAGTSLGACAIQAADILPKYGFVKTSSTLDNAKKGEVCVLAGGHHVLQCGSKKTAPGTIAVKTSTGWWDGEDRATIKWPGFRLVGCFIKSKS